MEKVMIQSLFPQSWTTRSITDQYARLSPLLPPSSSSNGGHPGSSRAWNRLWSGNSRRRSTSCVLVSIFGVAFLLLIGHITSSSSTSLWHPGTFTSAWRSDPAYYTPRKGFRPGTISSVPHDQLDTTRFFQPPYRSTISLQDDSPTSLRNTTELGRGRITGRPAQRDREFPRFPFRWPDEANRFAEARLRKCLPEAFWEEHDLGRESEEGREEEEEEQDDVGKRGVESGGSRGRSRRRDHTPDSVQLKRLASPRQDSTNGTTSRADTLEKSAHYPSSATDESLPEGCGSNERKIVLLNSWWFVESLKGSHTGEAEWAGSMIDALYANNYTLLFSSLGWLNTELWLLKDQYMKYRPFVKLIVGEPEVWEKCWNELGCIKDPKSDVDLSEVDWQGVRGGVFDPWKMVSFHYWDYVANRLGKDWTLSPFPTNDHRVVSFSIESTCSTHPYRPLGERDHRQAYVYGKQVQYLDTSSAETAWDIRTLEALGKEFDVPLIAAMRNDDAKTWLQVESSGIDNVGPVDAEAFLGLLSTSDVFIGIGRPRISPSPFDALCMGVPFINPILEWDPENYLDRSKWRAQQWAMHNLEAPHVYHVHKGDLLGLRTAVKAAFDNPIESYIPDYMTFDYMCDSMAALVEEDWKGKYDALEATG